ncbi:MAG: peptidase M14, partial [Flavobacteriales bacterium]
MKLVIFLCLFLIAADSSAQENDITAALYDSYDQFKEPSLEKRRIKHKELQPLINRLKSDPKYTVKVVGKSIEGRDLSLISIGSGPTSVFLWSQMHGDEPTATQA